MDFLESVEVYAQVVLIVDIAIKAMFGLVGTVADEVDVAVSAAAAIYVAMLGYSVFSGAIAMSAREITIRIAKVVAIVVLFTLIKETGGIYDLIWKPIDGLADEIVQSFNPITNVPIGSVNALAGFHSGLASILSAEVASAQKDSTSWGILTWVIAMAPLILMLVGIYIAKFVSALLLMTAPIVFIASLVLDTSRGNSIIMTWIRMVAMTLLSVIFIQIVGVVGVSMTGAYMGILLGSNTVIGAVPILADSIAQYSIPRLAPMGILSLLSVMLISQATTIAGGLLNVAGIQTQTAQSMMQIGALNAAR